MTAQCICSIPCQKRRLPDHTGKFSRQPAGTGPPRTSRTAKYPRAVTCRPPSAFAPSVADSDPMSLPPSPARPAPGNADRYPLAVAYVSAGSNAGTGSPISARSAFGEPLPQNSIRFVRHRQVAGVYGSVDNHAGHNVRYSATWRTLGSTSALALRSPQLGCHGSMTSIPVSRKSLTFRVARAAPRARQMAAI